LIQPPITGDKQMILDESQSAILDFSVISTSEESNSIEFKKAIDAYITHLNGSWPIYKILIANNGLAALKKIKSIRKWCFSTFGYSQAIKLLVMATTDDLEANAEYIRLADGYIEVPSGTNNFNYANVDLIVQLAQKYCVQVQYQCLCITN
jgi:acetyl-CoA carboxylase/biotin carboxylase 1